MSRTRQWVQDLTLLVARVGVGGGGVWLPKCTMGYTTSIDSIPVGYITFTLLHNGCQIQLSFFFQLLKATIHYTLKAQWATTMLRSRPECVAYVSKYHGHYAM